MGQGDDLPDALFRHEGQWVDFDDLRSSLAPDLDEGSWGEECFIVLGYLGHLGERRDPAGLISTPLHELAVRWFDRTERGFEPSKAPFTDLFSGADISLEVSQIGGNILLSLVADQTQWVTATKGTWQMGGHLTATDLLHRRAIASSATSHLIRAAELERQGGLNTLYTERAVEEQLAVAHAYRASYPIIPTFEDYILSLSEAEKLDWRSMLEVLALNARAAFLVNQRGIAEALVVETNHARWVRRDRMWCADDTQGSDSADSHEIDLHDLHDEVAWWDSTGSGAKLADRDVRDRTVYFVTGDDPSLFQDFSLTALVLSDCSENDAWGWVRADGAWHYGHIPVLDIENHMPADEGDTRPWGGQYLYVVPADLAPSALEFWDWAQATENDSLISWSDFLLSLREEQRRSAVTSLVSSPDSFLPPP